MKNIYKRSTDYMLKEERNVVMQNYLVKSEKAEKKTKVNHRWRKRNTLMQLVGM